MSLTAQQPVNNVVRTAVEALAAILGGTNSLHTNALDETLALPTDESAEIALRTQQVLMEETGVINVADPLGGSWYVEALTDRIEAEAEEIFARIRELGAATAADDLRASCAASRTAGSPRNIAEAAFVYQQALEKGDKKIVGVNCHTGTVAKELEILRVSHEVELEQRRELAARKAAPGRGPRSRRRCAGWSRSRRTDENMIPAMLDAARAEATLGEICDALRAEWGIYREPARF